MNRLNCFDKSLLAFQVACTGRRISYSGILYLKGEPDADRLREAILATARAHPELRTTLCGGPLQHHRRVQDEIKGEVLEVQQLEAANSALRQELAGTKTKLQSEVLQVKEHFAGELEKQVSLLKDSNVSRETLAELLQEMAVKLRRVELLEELTNVVGRKSDR